MVIADHINLCPCNQHCFYPDNDENQMTTNTKKPSWTQVKSILVTKEPVELLMLIKDLYALNKNNKTFIEARYQVSNDVLEPYKKIISDALYPDVYKNKTVSLSAGRKAISDYKKAVNDPAGTIELMVHYLDKGNQFTLDYGDMYDEFYNSLVSMLESILKLLVKADASTQDNYIPELQHIIHSARSMGWGYYDQMLDLFAAYFPDTAWN
ncbi:MAG: hypothetical protein LUP91_03160 [Methylococcaceae bacterium]|nr:hypothetical protein [Methylococcaceae bacterium]